MGAVLAIGTLLGLAGSVSVYGKRKFEEALPVAASGMIFCLYMFALFHHLALGVWILLVGGVAALAATAVGMIISRNEKPWSQMFTPGFAAFLLVALWVLISCRGFFATQWDDFSHWQLVVKNMMLLDDLPASYTEATVTYRSYLPGSSLFAYFFTKLSGIFNEGDVQRSVNILIFCFLLPLMRTQDWRHWKSALGMALALFMLPLAFEQRAYQIAYVDVALGCMVLFVLCEWFLRPHDRYSIVAVAATIMLLTLVKDSGFPLALFLIVLMTIDCVCCQQKQNGMKQIRMVICFAALCFLVKGSWSLYLRIMEVPQKWSFSSPGLMTCIRAFLGKGNGYQREALNNFISALFDPNRLEIGHVIQPSLLGLMGLFAVIAQYLLAQYESAQQFRRCRFAVKGLLVGLCIWSAALLSLYLFVMKDWEARSLSSYSRYLSTFLLPISGFLIALADHTLRERWQKKGMSLSLAVVMCLLILVNPQWIERATVHAAARNQEAYQKREAYFAPQDELNKLLPSETRIFVVSIGDDGFDYWYNAYELTPYPIQTYDEGWWIVGEKDPEYWHEMNFAHEHTVESWSEVLRSGNYTHVYLFRTNEKFCSAFGEMFEDAAQIADRKLFTISEDGERISLSALE